MKCYCCGKPGRATGIWRSPIRRNVFIRFKCHNTGCTFEYTNMDGQPAKAQPTWMTPQREVR